MKEIKSVNNLTGGGGSPEQSQRVVFGRQLDENYSQTSARQAKPRFRLQARAVAFNAKGGEPAEPVAERHPRLNPCVWTTIMRGFTMAEILLSLTIIGVVAAITLPSLTGNINERTWNTQRKALYARFSQAISLMPAINGYGTLKEVTDSATGSTSIEDTAAETFVTAGLSKVMKINNICDNNHLEDCGLASRITTADGEQISMPKTMAELNSQMTMSASNGFNTTSMLDTKAAAFETQNGESVLVFYNPGCIGSLQETPWGGGVGYYIQNKICANFIYDLNGTKGPNTVGKDIGFMTAMYPSDVKLAMPIPAPTLASDGVVGVDASKTCTDYGSEYRLPNIEEGISIFVNQNLLSADFNNAYWTSSKIIQNGETRMLLIVMRNGDRGGQVDDLRPNSEQRPVLCVRR